MSELKDFQFVASTSPSFWNGRRLSEHLVSVVCDGVAVMLGNHSGVMKMKESFPSVIVWNYVNHRLELPESDAMHAPSGINRFESSINKLHVLYHASPKK
jgi:hypothetical protein